MKLLLDICTFLWLIADASDLSQRAKDLFADPANEAYLSAVSGWEIALKHALGRLPLPEAPDQFVPDQRQRHGIESLVLDEESALHVARLPALHRDPFDRMLVCQALVHGLIILDPIRSSASTPCAARGEATQFNQIGDSHFGKRGPM